MGRTLGPVKLDRGIVYDLPTLLGMLEVNTYDLLRVRHSTPEPIALYVAFLLNRCVSTGCRRMTNLTPSIYKPISLTSHARTPTRILLCNCVGTC